MTKREHDVVVACCCREPKRAVQSVALGAGPPVVVGESVNHYPWFSLIRHPISHKHANGQDKTSTLR